MNTSSNTAIRYSVPAFVLSPLEADAVAAILARVRRLRDLVETDPSRGREALTRLVGDDGITMTPKGTAYLATWSVGVDALLETPTPPRKSSEALEALLNASGCGGRI